MTTHDSCLNNGGCTNYAVYTLTFAISYGACFKYDKRCGLLKYDYYYVTAQVVDIGAAFIMIVDGGGLQFRK